MKHGMCLLTLVSPTENKHEHGKQEAISKHHLKINCAQSPEGTTEKTPVRNTEQEEPWLQFTPHS